MASGLRELRREEGPTHSMSKPPMRNVRVELGARLSITPGGGGLAQGLGIWYIGGGGGCQPGLLRLTHPPTSENFSSGKKKENLSKGPKIGGRFWVQKKFFGL